MKRVRFGMYWESYGHQDIELPDGIDENDHEAVCDYIRNNWNDIPIPSGEYVMGSDDFEPETIEVYEDNMNY